MNQFIKLFYLLGIFFFCLLSNPQNTKAQSEEEIWREKYDMVWGFSDGLARVLKDNRYGFVNKSGKEIIAVGSLYAAEDFSEGFAVVKRMKEGSSYAHTDFGYIDITGKALGEFKYGLAYSFRDGVAQVQLEDVSDSWALIDSEGKYTVASGVYAFIDRPYEGMSQVTHKENRLIGFVDPLSGLEIIKPVYKIVGNFSEGLAVVSKDREAYGFVDIMGDIVIPMEYEHAGSFLQGLAIAKKEGKYGFIDKSGKTIIKFQYDDAFSFDENDRAWVQKGEKWGVIDKKGKVIVDFKYFKVINPQEGIASAQLEENGKKGFVTVEGKEITKFIYTQAYSFSHGIAPVILEGKKWGFVDNSGKMITDFIYDNINSIDQYGITPVRIDKNWFYMDKTGKHLNKVK